MSGKLVMADDRRRPTTTALRQKLEPVLSEHLGGPCRITTLERQPSAYRTSFPIEDLVVTLEDGSMLSIVFKDVGWQSLPKAVQKAKPEFLYDPLREIRTYERILTPNGLGLRYFGALVDPSCDLYWLFVARAPGVELYQVGDIAVWEGVARWLAALHSRFAGRTEELMARAPLVIYDRTFYQTWLGQAREYSRRPSSSGRVETSFIHGLASKYEGVVIRLLGLPQTFIHGEFYDSNILVDASATTPPGVFPVDWELAGRGPGLIDLAALTAGNWADEERERLALAYYDALPQDTECRPGLINFLESLDYCRLHLAVQWLGWSAEWNPPLEHTRDWLREAIQLTEKLGL